MFEFQVELDDGGEVTIIAPDPDDAVVEARHQGYIPTGEVTSEEVTIDTSAELNAVLTDIGGGLDRTRWC